MMGTVSSVPITAPSYAMSRISTAPRKDRMSSSTSGHQSSDYEGKRAHLLQITPWESSGKPKPQEKRRSPPKRPSANSLDTLQAHKSTTYSTSGFPPYLLFPVYSNNEPFLIQLRSCHDNYNGSEKIDAFETSQQDAFATDVQKHPMDDTLDPSEEVVRTTPLPEMGKIVLKAHSMCSSKSPTTRTAGFSILRMIFEHHSKPPAILRRWIWYVMLAKGLDGAEEPRLQQLAVLSQLVDSSPDVLGLNGCLMPTLEWIKGGVDKGLLDSHDVLKTLHAIMQKLAASHAAQCNEEQIDSILDVYAVLVKRALSDEATSLNIRGRSTKEHEGHVPASEHVAMDKIRGEGGGFSTSRTQTLLSETARSLFISPVGQLDRGDLYPFRSTIVAAACMLSEIVDLIMAHDILSTLQLTRSVTLFCDVLGQVKQGGSSPHARGIAMDFIHRLLCSDYYDIASLEVLESLLSYKEGERLQVVIGALDAYSAFLYRTIDNVASDRPIGGAGRLAYINENIAYEELLSFLETVTPLWIGKVEAEPLFTNFAELVRRVVSSSNWIDSLALSQFVGVSVLRLATFMGGNIHNSPRLHLSELSEEEGYVEYSSLDSNIESLLGHLLKTPQMPKELVPSLLLLANSLYDEDLLLILNKGWSLLSPIHSDWAGYLRSLAKIYCEKAPGSLESRRAIVTRIEATYDSIIDVEIFHCEVRNEISTIFAETLPLENDERILQVAFRILNREMALLASAKCEFARSTAIRLCESWAILARAPCGCQTSEPSKPENDCDNAGPELKDCSRQLLAIQFLVKAFNNLVFPTSSMLPGVLCGAEPGDTSVAAGFAMSLFRKLLRMTSSKHSDERISCRKTRLALLQWLLRLRADSDHRLYLCEGSLPEVESIAKLAERTEGVDSERFWAQNDADFDLKRRREERAKLKQRTNSYVSVPGTRDQKTTGTQCDLTEWLWRFPEECKIEIPSECTRRSPVVITHRLRNQTEESNVLIPLPEYVSFISDMLSDEHDWELVSYILCYLPAQLFNSYLFCSSKTRLELQNLAKVVCRAIADSKVYHSEADKQSRTLRVAQTKALFYQTLVIFIGHHEWLESLMDKPGYDRIAHYTVVESLVEGLSCGSRIRGYCLEVLSLAIYEIPGTLRRYICDIVKRLTDLATDPAVSVLTLEFLFMVGYSQEVHSGVFGEMDYKRVFKLALIHIQTHSTDHSMRVPSGKRSYSLAQHIHNMSFVLIYVWFLAIPVDQRIKFVPFITNDLADANARNKSREPRIEVALDWLAHYSYGNADNVPHPSYLYMSMIAPSTDPKCTAPAWPEKKRMEMENVIESRAFKVGNAIMIFSTLENGWARVVMTRPSGETEFLCRFEGLRHVVENLEQSYPVVADLLPDVVQISESNPETPSSAVQKQLAIASALIPDMIHPGFSSTAQIYQNMDGLDRSLEVLHHTPPFERHRVGVLYVGPGQTGEMEILSNKHGSLTYSRVISRLGRVMEGTQWHQAHLGNVRPDIQGQKQHLLCWWDDVNSISYHVATSMPNIDGCMLKKQQIGNDAVKIIWNNGNRPYEFSTIRSDYNLVNILVEPHSRAASAAVYSASLSNHFKVSMQTAPRMPRVTPLQGYKIVTLEALPVLLRHVSLLACLFCEAWIGTGEDGPVQYPLETNREARLRYIINTEKYL